VLSEVVNTLRKTVADAVARAEYDAPQPSALDDRQRCFWSDNGYLLLERYYSPARIAAVNRFIDDCWQNAAAEGRRTVIDTFIGTPRERRMRLADAPAEARRQPYKLNDLYLESDFIRHIVFEQDLARIYAELLGGAPVVCNTLSVEFGTQQPDHTDSLYMTPPSDGTMVAAWIALEDVHADAGPLRFWPGSQQIPGHRFSTGRLTAVAPEMPVYQRYMERECRERGLQVQTLEAPSGSVFIWHAQLFHGGSPIRDRSLTRKSLIAHFWRAKDLPGVHGKAGPGRFWYVRPPQPVS
jgi:phytanoyl-CoA hydroxylase